MGIEHAENFREICRQVCDAHGWDLQPNGIHVPLEEGRGQVVGMELFEYQDETLVRLTTVIGRSFDLSRVRLDIALRLNAEIPHGAFAILQGELVMTDTLRVDQTDADEFGASVRYMAETADRQEQHVFGTDEH